MNNPDLGHPTFAEVLYRKLNGKLVEVFCGDMGVTRQYSQDSLSMKEVVRGRIVGAEGEVLILEVSSADKENVNLVYLNAWNIKSVTSPGNGISLTDVYNREHKKVRK